MAIETTTNASTISRHYVSVPRYYLIALGELGVREVPGAASNPRINEYAASTTLKATSDEVPWCSSFANWCVVRAGLVGTQSAAAKSWITWGVDVGLDSKRWSIGDVMVFARDGGNHVAFFQGYTQPIAPVPNPAVIGGNQNNAVSVAFRQGHDLLAVRRTG